MLDSLPHASHQTCLLAPATTSGPPAVWLSRLKRSGQVGRRQIILPVPPAKDMKDCDKLVAVTLPALLSECQVVHYDMPWGPEVLNDTLCGQGLSPMSNPTHDIAPFVRRILAGSAGASLDLMDIPGLCGRIPSAPSRAQEKAPPAGRVLEMVYSRLVRPRLHSGIDLGVDRHTTSRALDPVEPTGTGPCLSIPDLPDLSPPAGGWRTDPWLAPEAMDVARRFSSGTSLEDLSLMTGRSARAILARLQIDGVVKRG